MELHDQQPVKMTRGELLRCASTATAR